MLSGRLALARSATDRAAQHRGDDAWLERAWADRGTRVLVVGGGRTLVRGEQLDLLEPAAAPSGERYLLGVDAGGTAFFAVDIGSEPQPLPGSDVVAAGLREVGTLLSDRDAGLLVLAVGLSNWHATHVRCPDPAVIMLVTDASGERGLLGSSNRWPGRRFSTLAGFVEPGESAEAAVVREVQEESGVRVGDVTYLGSQPWPFPSSLMLGFTAVALDPDAEPVADGVELAEVRWFTRAQVTDQVTNGELRLPPRVSIARRLVEHWYGGELPPEPAGGW